MIASLINNAINGRKKDLSLSFRIKPENNAMAITGENPDQPGSGPKKYLQIVVKTINMRINRIIFPLSFIIKRIKPGIQLLNRKNS